MALTRDQLAVLQPPVGWEFTVRPSLRTQGTIKVDAAQRLTYANAPERLQRLEAWARDNGLGVRALTGTAFHTVVRSPYRTFRVTTTFKVSANKPELLEETLKAGPCVCGYININVGTMYTDCCGTQACRVCMQSGTRLYSVGQYGAVCSACSVQCAEEGCDARIMVKAAHKKCSNHSDIAMCVLCGLDKERKTLVKFPDTGRRPDVPYYPPDDTSFLACETCVAKYTCPKCKQFKPMEPLRNKMCTDCADKENDEKLAKLAVFDKDELPISGSLVIPSLPSRPFRTISIETEMDGDGGYLARTLYRCGHVPINRVASYGSHPQRDADYIAFLKHDGSVSAGELISYLLNLDDEKHADTLMDLLKKINGLHKMGMVQFNSNCGGHIHIDAHNYGYGSVWRLLTGFGYIEDPVYRIAGAGCEYGHRTLDPGHDRANGGRGYTHSPVKGPFGSKGAVGQQIGAQDRMCGLNFQPFLQAVRNCQCGAWAYEDSRRCKCDLGKATIEWRVFNSTHNPRILHGWIALMQALHAWADEDIDPTPEWELQYPALAWRKMKFDNTPLSHKQDTKKRLEWIHTELPLTPNERDSLCYAISKSDMADYLGAEYIASLKELPNNADVGKAKVTRNPARRQREIKIEPPTPGKKPKEHELTYDARLVDIQNQVQQAVWHAPAAPAAPPRWRQIRGR